VVLEQDSRWSVLVVALLVLVLGLAAVAAYHVLRPRLDRRWVRRHLRVEPGGRHSSAEVTEQAVDRSPRTDTIRISPRHDRGTHTVQEGEPR
jgi:hypothetical protein